jgi:hypothetical protein
MKRSIDFAIYCFRFAAVALLVAYTMTVAPAQQNLPYGGGGIVDDWTTHHVVFSNPGTLMDAMMNGRRQEWQSIVRDPRYRMQLIRQSVMSNPSATSEELQASNELRINRRIHWFRGNKHSPSLEGMWTIGLSPNALENLGTPEGMFPAKYTFAPIGTPNCTGDYVVFPIDTAGKAPGSLTSTNGQANILGVNNLYVTTCAGAPTELFAYYFPGGGSAATSPVLSEDGTKVAIVESLVSGSNFHVITLDARGNSGCATSTSPCNGPAAGTPVEPCTVIANGTSSSPCTYDDAVDNYVSLSGTPNVTLSSPFVDYEHDVAYVGDDKGMLHKITPVFNSTATNPPKEVSGDGWPFTVISGQILTGPTYDSVSGKVFVGAGNGVLYCVAPAATTVAACGSVTVGNGGGTNGPLDPPIVDSTQQTVYVTANNASASVLWEVNTSMTTLASAAEGKNGNSIHNGAFDHAYLTSSAGTGHMYFCGNDSSGNPMLYQFSITSGTMATPANGSFSVAQGVGNCTPLTEIFNPNIGSGSDLLFLGVDNNGFGTTATTTCDDAACIMSFNITGGAVPLGTDELTTTNLGSHGISGLIIDNVSSTTNASQIYFSNLNNSTATQLSQSGLD